MPQQTYTGMHSDAGGNRESTALQAGETPSLTLMYIISVDHPKTPDEVHR